MKKMMDSNEKTPILVLDLIRSILERLSFVDFHRARCVSRAWYSASESCIQGTNPTTPWIILFPKEDVESNNGSCKLFDPRDHDIYTVRDLGSDFARSRCLASSGSWFLMLEHRNHLYLLNLFTRQKIPLPSVESVHGCDSISIGSAVLWVDEKGRDYFVVLSFDCIFAYQKRGDKDESWKVLKPLKNKDCVDMVFKEGKLYVLSPSREVTVYDFSGGDTPVECASLPSPGWLYYRENLKNLAVTLSGEVLIISSQVNRGTCFFYVYKMDPKSTGWKRTKSIGDEVLLLDLGVTVAAKDGVMKNCIYFSNDQFRRYCENSLCNGDNGICVYHIKTEKVIQVFNHLTASSPVQSAFKDARWFFPTFGGKWLY